MEAINMSIKSNKKTYLAIVTALLIGLALGWIGGLFQAQRRLSARTDSLGFDRAAVIRSLDDSQRKTFREIRQAHRGEMQALREELVKASTDFDEAVQKEAPSEALRERYAKIVELRSKQDWAQFNMTMQMKPHLRPDQMKHLRMHSERKGKRGWKGFGH